MKSGQRVRLARDVFPDDDVRQAGLLASRGSARYALGDLEGARDDSAQVVEIRKARRRSSRTRSVTPLR